MTGKFATQSEAPESNAGDDFHLLWAARLALQMLNPTTTLTALSIEGPNPSEAAEIDAGGTQLLGIDVTEYHGGITFKDCSATIHTQLKYSTRRSDVNWTASRITTGKGGKKTGSIVLRLAQVYRTYAESFPRADLLNKLRLRLVSNRSCDPVLLAAVTAAKDLLSRAQGEHSVDDLIKELASSYHIVVRKLYEASKLSSIAFCDFLRVLDLSGCGEGSRLTLEVKLAKEIGSLGFTDIASEYGRLKQFIHSRMMPENRKARPLTQDDVAAALHIPDKEYIFPCPAQFEPLIATVKREQLEEIAKVIVNAQEGPVCLHGAAGIGKTTLSRSVVPLMPRGSVVVIFDCYGAGSYLVPSEIRHSHSRAIAQICNELATLTGTALLLGRDRPPEDLLRAFESRLQSASQIIQASSGAAALIVIVIDAADNSVAAASQRGDKSFVPDLLAGRIPPACRLVVTARTHRRHQLGLPSSAVSVELKSFSALESRDNLRRKFPDVSDDITAEFHELSNGIPRVQAYAIGVGAGDLQLVMAAMRPGGKTVESIINRQLKAAGLKSGLPGLIEKGCRALLSLPRPIPVSYIAQLMDVSIETARDFVSDLRPGLLVENDHATFRDEDFESHLRQRHEPEVSLFCDLANLFSVKSKDDAYAAENIADVFARANQHERIIELVKSERQPPIIKDPIVRQEVFARRARLAVAAALRLHKPDELINLLFVVAEASKVDKAVEDLLLQNADLACRYGDPASVQRLYLNEKNTRVEWYGPTHLLCAANYSRFGGTRKRAEDHLEQARGWIRYWSSLSDNERKEWQLHVNDIAHETEAALRLKGLDHAIGSVSRWRPASFRFDVVRMTAKTIIAQEGLDAFTLMKGARMPRGGALAIVEAAMDAGFLPPIELCRPTFDAWLRLVSSSKPTLSDSLKRALVLLGEAMTLHRADAASVLRLLDAVDPAIPTNLSLHSDESMQIWDVRLRAWALCFQIQGKNFAADDTTLLPARLQEALPEKDQRAHHRREEEVKEFQKLLGRVFPSYLLRAKFIAGAIEASNVLTQFAKIGKPSDSSDYSYGRHDFEWRQSNRLRTWTLTDLAVRLSPHEHDLLDLVIKEHLNGAGDDLVLRVAEKAVLFPRLRDLAVGLISRIESDIQKVPRPANEQVNLYVRCSRIAGLCDQQLGQYYFQRAVDAAAEIDEEATSLLETLCSVTERGMDGNAHRDDPSAAGSLAQITERIYSRLGDSDQFPWSKLIRSITSLSASIAAFTLGRWDQQGIVLVLDYANAWVAESLHRGAISPEAAVAFNVLSALGSESAMKTALAGLDKLAAAQPAMYAAMKIISDHCQRLAPIGERKMLTRVVGEWTKTKKIEVLLPELEQFLKTLDHKHESELATTRISEQHNTPLISAADSESVDWDKILGSARYDNPAALTEMIRAANPKMRSREPWDRHNRHTSELLERLTRLTQPESYVSQLDALLNIELSEIDFGDLLKAIKERIVKWEHHALVREWRNKLPSLIARRRFDDFTSGAYFSFYRLEQVEDALGVPRIAMAEALAEELPDHLRELHAQAVYGLIQLLVKALPAAMAMDVLQNQLKELGAKLAHEGLSVGGVSDRAPIASGIRLEAAVLWFLYGHPDKRIRWRAIHATRRMVQMGRTEILLQICSLISDAKESPFLLNGTTFYWLSAKQSFLMLLDRLSVELPAAVIPLADFLLNETLMPSPPHALIMMFAKRAALRLGETGFSPYDRATVRRIQKSMQPKVAKRKGDRRGGLQDDYRHVRTDRFRFDSIDTLPYWYSPAGEVFGIDANVFCSMAEKWICDKWGINGRALENDPVRNWRRDDRDWQLRSKRHGDVPVIEDLETYLEFNAMFCVTGELVTASKRVFSRYSDSHDPWGDWLGRWDNARQDEWLSDRRQRTPLERLLWIGESNSDAHAMSLPSDTLCDQSIGFVDSQYPGYLLVNSDESHHRYGNTLTQRIYSALVSTGTAEALLHAVANCSDPHDYRIPLEGDELEYNEIINDMPFVLKGWIASPYSDREGADRYDPLRYQLEKMDLIPGKKFRQRHRLNFDDKRITTRRKGAEMPITFVQHWNDFVGHERYRGSETEGKRLWVRGEELLSFLKHERCALILKCEVTLRPDSDMRSSENQDGEKNRLYLIQESGTVTAIAGRNRPRKPDR